MRIVFFSPKFTFGGAEKHLAQIVRGLHHLGSEIIVIAQNTKAWNETYLRTPDIQLIEYQFDDQYLNIISCINKVRKLSQTFRDLTPNVLIADRKGGAFWASLAGKLAGVPNIISRRGDVPYTKRKRYPRILEKMSFKFTDWCVVNSEIVANRLSDDDEGMKRSQTQVIYQGVEIPLNIGRGSASFRQKFKIPLDAVVVGMLATFWSIKNHILLLRAAARIIEMYPKTVFVLAGGAIEVLNSQVKYYKNVLSTIEEYNLQANVRLTGTLADPSNFLTTIDIGVLCSVAEGLSNSILEYMAYGKPVIATRVGGNAEVIIHGETGLIVESKDEDGLVDALSYLLKDPAECVRMGQLGRVRVKECFTIEETIKKWDRLIVSL